MAVYLNGIKYDMMHLSTSGGGGGGGGGALAIEPTYDEWQHNTWVTLRVDIDKDGNLSIRQSAGGGTTTGLRICYPQGSDTTITKIPNIPTEAGTYTLPITAVWSGDSNDHTITYSVVESGGGGGVTVEPLSVTANGTYTAPSGKAYSPVTVDVAGKAAQASDNMARVAATTATATNVSLTVAKTGTYTVRWYGYRSSTSGTNGSQLYIGNTAYGTEQTTFSVNSNGQTVKLTGVQLTAGQTITVRARSRGTSYYMWVMGLSIVEE